MFPKKAEFSKPTCSDFFGEIPSHPAHDDIITSVWQVESTVMVSFTPW